MRDHNKVSRLSGQGRGWHVPHRAAQSCGVHSLPHNYAQTEARHVQLTNEKGITRWRPRWLRQKLECNRRPRRGIEKSNLFRDPGIIPFRNLSFELDFLRMLVIGSVQE
jgi:hypothetical protein